MVRAKKHLGQHFLKDENIAKSIADALLAPQLPLLEIGPGTGVLTQYFYDKSDFYAAEVDEESVEYLRASFPQMSLRILQGDVLKMNLHNTFTDQFNIIGNFPYNISSQIFFLVLNYRAQVDEVVCMIQKEVAERIAEAPGTKTYGILSVLLQAYYDIDYLFTVGPQVFDPPPKVNSAVIRLKRNAVAALDCNEKAFFRIVKMAFGQRRKTLRNSLKSEIAGRAEIAENEIFNLRPERLSVGDFVYITQLLANN